MSDETKDDQEDGDSQDSTVEESDCPPGMYRCGSCGGCILRPHDCGGPEN